LTKKCIGGDNYKVKGHRVNKGNGESEPLKCNEISEKQWDSIIDRMGGVDPRKEMKDGDCFCDEQWTDTKCDETPKIPPTNRISKSRSSEHADYGDDNFSYAAPFLLESAVLAAI